METIYRKVYTKDRLPHPEGTYFVKVKDNVLFHDIYFWHHHYDDIANEDQKDYWINTFEWWLEEIALPDEEEIRATIPYPESISNAQRWKNVGFIRGALWLLNKIKGGK